MVEFNSLFWAGSRPLATLSSLCLLGGAIALAPISAAEAFSIHDNGSIDVFRTAADNPAGKSDIGRWFDVSVDGNIDGQDYAGLSSLFRFNVSEFNVGGGMSTVILNVEGYVGMFDDNVELFEDYRASLFGFQIDPNFSAVDVTGAFNNAVAGKNITANGGIDIDVCFKQGGGPNCNGGTSGGISKGEMGTFQIALNFDQEIDSFNLSNFGVRYQDVNSEHYGLRRDGGTGTGQAIPEPLTIIGTGAALAFGALFRKKLQAQA